MTSGSNGTLPIVSAHRHSTSESVDWNFEAQLFGGAGNGLTIRLAKLVPQVTVFRNGGPPLAMPGSLDESACPEARRIGVYELVQADGPETPIYISS
jgi:hypothetical protein